MSDNPFTSEGYRAINYVRLSHLSRLGLPLVRRTVLELGCGQGDLTYFWLNRGCDVTCVEGRRCNCNAIRSLYQARVQVAQHDLCSPRWPFGTFDIVFAYGVLYHLPHPISALHQWASSAAELLLLETVVSHTAEPVPHQEPATDPTGALHGCCEWPAAQDVLDALRTLFRYVYLPVEVPAHVEFDSRLRPRGQTYDGLHREVFIGSHTPQYSNALLRVGSEA